MSILMDIETFAKLTGSTPELVRINLQENNLTLLNGLSIGKAHKKDPNQKNFVYMLDKVKAVQYIKELRAAEKDLVDLELANGEI